MLALRRVLPILGFSLLVFLPVGTARAQIIPPEMLSGRQWNLVEGSADTLSYAMFVRIVPDASADTLEVYYNTRAEPTAWKAGVAGKKYVSTPPYGVFEIDARTESAYAFWKSEPDADGNRIPDVLEAMDLIGRIDGAVRSPSADLATP